jgi:hypothetical protein
MFVIAWIFLTNSPMGEFVLKRETKIALLQKVTSNEASIMVDGQEQ